MPRLCLSLLLSLLFASSASAVTMDWAYVGNPGNACNNTPPNGCRGAVGYAYWIGTYEVTNAQYAEFLNAKAASDPFALYNTSMGSSSAGGITRSGVAGSFTYAAIAGRENMPVNFVGIFDAARFANWMNNGQGNGSTETGAYSSVASLARSANATIVLPTINEWYKAAFYDAASASYFAYPTASNIETVCSAPGATPNTANCGNAVGGPTVVGSYTGSASPYGTFDQGGNVWEWMDVPSPFPRHFSGGAYDYPASYFAAGTTQLYFDSGSIEDPRFGFRLAMIPEPGTGLLVIAGLLGLGMRRRISA
jgi:PEP-CTERM putative exosortase interaction domain